MEEIYYEQEEQNEKKTYRNAFIRVTAVNHIKKDNEALGVEEGDEVTYTKEDILNTIKEWTLTKTFDYFLIEHNVNCVDHFHIVLVFSNNSCCTFRTLKNKFPYGKITSCHGSVKNCVRYLCHLDQPEKTQYDCAEVITNAPDKLEKYITEGATSFNARVNEVLTNIKNGKTKKFEIAKIPLDIYAKKKPVIDNAFDHKEKTAMLDPNRNIEVIVLQGSPGTGKTSMAKKNCRGRKQEHILFICIARPIARLWRSRYFGLRRF